MNSELLAILNYMERDRGIDREVLIQAVEFALQSAARKTMKVDDGVRVAIDRSTCDMKILAMATVVEDSMGKKGLISLADARKHKPDAEVGDEIETEVTLRNFGRIAAQTAKQAITQKIRQAERDVVYDEYKDRVGDIVSGAVRQFNRSDIIVDLGRAEAILPSRERVPTEEYQIGDRIRGYILNVQNNPNGPSVVLSRSHPDFVRRLFELEVSEITDNIVSIKAIAREPGYRTKIAVVSNDEKVDPVGACVGMRGMRVKNIVRELSGEKIDIIRWSDDVKTYVTNALSPAKLTKVTVGAPEEKVVHVIADSTQLSLAIGKRGQNVRLSSRLIGWRIDIQKDESEITFEEKLEKAVASLATVDGISRENAETLVNSGFLSVEGILAAEISDLIETTGMDEETANAVYAAANASTTHDDAQKEQDENESS